MLHAMKSQGLRATGYTVEYDDGLYRIALDGHHVGVAGSEESAWKAAALHEKDYREGWR